MVLPARPGALQLCCEAGEPAARIEKGEAPVLPCSVRRRRTATRLPVPRSDTRQNYGK